MEDRFIQSILRAVNGEKGVMEETYVYLPGVPGGKEIVETLGVEFFAVPVELAADGAVKAYPIGKISKHEEGMLKVAVKELKDNIKKGVDFVKL